MTNMVFLYQLYLINLVVNLPSVLTRSDAVTLRKFTREVVNRIETQHRRNLCNGVISFTNE